MLKALVSQPQHVSAGELAHFITGTWESGLCSLTVQHSGTDLGDIDVSDLASRAEEWES